MSIHLKRRRGGIALAPYPYTLATFKLCGADPPGEAYAANRIYIREIRGSVPDPDKEPLGGLAGCCLLRGAR